MKRRKIKNIVIEGYVSGLPVSEIAKEAGTTENSVRATASRLGIQHARPRRSGTVAHVSAETSPVSLGGPEWSKPQEQKKKKRKPSTWRPKVQTSPASRCGTIRSYDLVIPTQEQVDNHQLALESFISLTDEQKKRGQG
ncbi:MAG: hypothetical protein AAGK02_04605 [Pseudomonadota bacterium]